MADHVGQNIKEAVRLIGIQGLDLARELGVTPRAIYNQYAEAKPRLATLEKYAEALNRFLPEDGPRFSAQSLQVGPAPVPCGGAEVATAVEVVEPPFAAGRARRVAETPGDVVLIRDLAEVPCGKPLPSERAGTWVGIPKVLLRRGMTADNTIILHAVGTSMVGDGIWPGDLLLVRTDINPLPNAPIVVNTDQGAMVKRYQPLPAGGWRLEAAPADPQADRRVDLTGFDHLDIVGVVMGKIRCEDVG